MQGVLPQGPLPLLEPVQGFLTMGVKINRNFQFRDLIKGLTSEAMMKQEGKRLADDIERRTLSGRDENNRGFTPYSADYAKRKGSKKVNLTASGAMFDDFGVVRSTRSAFSLGFRSQQSQKKAVWHDTGAGSLPERHFLGVPESWIRGLMQRLRARVR
jgi:hypothetical protein